VKTNAINPWFVVGAFLLFLFTFVVWYVEADNFNDEKISGTYTFHSNSVASTLVLKSDHGFWQQLYDGEGVKRAEGSWRVSGEGHIEFSPEFLSVPGQDMSFGGQAYGQINNTLGLVSITLAPNQNGPNFRKKLFK
jgi:hypothetical protein